MELWVIDRVEEGWAVCQNEQGEQRTIPFHHFPQSAKEGSWFTLSPEGKPELSGEETMRRHRLALSARRRLLTK